MTELPAPRRRPRVVHDVVPLDPPEGAALWCRQFLVGALLGLAGSALVQLLARLAGVL
jgi:hypothetical protein